MIHIHDYFLSFCAASLPLLATFLHQVIGLPLLIVLAVLIVFANVFYFVGLSMVSPLPDYSKLNPTYADLIMEPTQRKSSANHLPFVVPFLLNIVTLFFIAQHHTVGINGGILLLMSIPFGIIATIGMVLIMHPRLLIIELVLFVFSAPLLAAFVLT